MSLRSRDWNFKLEAQTCRLISREVNGAATKHGSGSSLLLGPSRTHAVESGAYKCLKGMAGTTGLETPAPPPTRQRSYPINYLPPRPNNKNRKPPHFSLPLHFAHLSSPPLP